MRQADPADLKIWDEVKGRKGKHRNGEANVCLWQAVEGKCVHGNDGRFSHDPDIKIADTEKKACLRVMQILFKPRKEGAGGKKGKGRSRSATPVNRPKVQEICRNHQAGKCTWGDRCRYLHQ